MITHLKKSTDRQFRSATGYGRERFAKLLCDFECTFLEEYGLTYEVYIEENSTEVPKFKTLEECLFLVLFQMKNDLIWDSLALMFGMSTTTARAYFQTFSGLLEDTLEKKSDAQKVF